MKKFLLIAMLFGTLGFAQDNNDLIPAQTTVESNEDGTQPAPSAASELYGPADKMVYGGVVSAIMIGEGYRLGIVGQPDPNPNKIPVCHFYYRTREGASHKFGFTLDGSELAKERLALVKESHNQGTPLHVFSMSADRFGYIYMEIGGNNGAFPANQIGYLHKQ